MTRTYLSETDGYARRSMRLVVARCEVVYTGRLNAFLPESTRLLMIKPLNWMTLS